MNRPNVALENDAFLLVSDVHAEIDALRRVFSYTTDARYICSLGDVVGYGPSPNDVLEEVADFDVAVMGNHDAAVLDGSYLDQFTEAARADVLRHRSELTQDSRDILARFAPQFRRRDILLFHGAPDDPTRYLFNENDIADVFAASPDISLFFGGHLHIPRVARQSRDGGKVEFEEVTSPYSYHDLDLGEYRYQVSVPSLTEGRMGFEPGYAVVYSRTQTEKALLFHTGF